MSVPENDLDVPLIKSDETRLPTYHLAHVVDDYLMRATIILRGQEWLPSTSLHIEIAKALGVEPFRYAHTPVISIIDPDGGGKRKLSKRKDPEADVAYWLKAAYPMRAIKAYLLGLANSNFEDWYRANPRADLSDFKYSLDKLAASRSPLLDMKKVEDYAKEEIASLPQEQFNKEVLRWTELHDHEFYKELIDDPIYTNKVLAIERSGEKPRKDVAKWSDVPEQFGYFYDDLFASRFNPDELKEVSLKDKNTAKKEFLKYYNHSANKDIWFENMKKSALAAGYTLAHRDSSKKQNPDGFKGYLADFAKIIRVTLTGKTRTPDLYTIMQVMGETRVRSRLDSNL
jgi:glutamyl-tRNA synthetase